ncbi:MAG: T9SS type A sorting domain-containing protein [Candidatus Hatepunaea meridiana]|nr:T9SS type A sorting domain-containing protein [Candidatus Hatepunaea meridiana]
MKIRFLLTAFSICIIFLSNPSIALNFTEHEIYEVSEKTVFSVWLDDLDDDGDLDILYAHGGGVFCNTAELFWFENDGEGSFEGHEILETEYSGWVLDAITFDFDGDGDLDIIAAITTCNYAEWDGDNEGIEGCFVWFENNGEEEFEIHIIEDDIEEACRVAISDIDADDDPDIIGIMMNWDGEWTCSVAWLENMDDGEFDDHIIIEREGRTLTNLSVLDFDLDGDSDILIGVFDERSSLIWFENDGDCEFETHEMQLDMENLTTLIPVDLDSDDDIDFVTGSWREDESAWFENDSRMGFTKHIIDRYHSNNAICVTDINDDERPDIVSGRLVQSWWSNEGGGVFNLHRTGLMTRPELTKAGDLDGDGDIDLASGVVSGSLWWFEQTDEDEDYDTLTIEIDEGWSMMSLPMVPWSVIFDDLFSPLLEDRNLNLMKDDQGRFFIREWDFNNLPPYKYDRGYWLNLNEPTELTVAGYVLYEHIPLYVPIGWSMLSYLLEDETEARSAFRNLLPEDDEALIIAKDDQGHFYYPASNYCNMPPLTRGKGYCVLLNRDATFTWSNQQRRDEIDTYRMAAEPVHFKTPAPTGSNMSIIIADSPRDCAVRPQIQFDSAVRPQIQLDGAVRRPRLTDSEIGLFNSSGHCAGVVVLEGDKPWGLAAWGDDPLTDAVEGFRDGEAIKFMLSDGNDEIELTAYDENGYQAIDPVYENNGILILSLSGSVVHAPVEFSLISVGPNPFNSTTLITFSIPFAGDVKLKLYDIQGREVRVIIDGFVSAGSRTIQVDLKDLPSGIYIYILNHSDSGMLARKMVLVK